MNTDLTKVTELFGKTEARFLAWLQGKPTGKFSFELSVNQGGLRGEPQISITEKLK